MIGPRGAALLDQALGVIDKILKGAGRRGWVQAACPRYLRQAESAEWLRGALQSQPPGAAPRDSG